MRRPEPTKKKSSVPPLLIPIVAGIAVVALVAVALVVLTGGDDTADPKPSPTVTAPTTPPASTFSPPPNAIPVGFGVSVVPVDGWSVLVTELKGKQLVSYAADRKPRAYIWVRQKENVTARTYLLGIVEGETAGEFPALGNVRELTCPKEVLVECVAISYTSTPKTGKIQGWVETYRRKDGVVTALDFRTSPDFAAKAEIDVASMKKSVIDSL